MARSIEEIYGEMIAQKEATTELDELTSTSRTAVWRLIFYIAAVAIKVVEDLFDVHKDMVEQRALELITGTLRWYASETLLYQDGDELVYDAETGRLIYEVIDEEKQIVDLSAATDDATGSVFIKAAKLNETTGEPEPLTAGELAGLDAYWNQKKFAGTNTVVSSDPGDKLQIGYRVIFNATILNENGQLISDTSIRPVDQAIQDYLITFGRRTFAGTFQLQELNDAVNNARGVINATPYEAIARKFDDTGAVDILAEPDQLYPTQSGYLVIDPLYPLDTQIIYISQV